MNDRKHSPQGAEGATEGEKLELIEVTEYKKLINDLNTEIKDGGDTSLCYQRMAEAFQNIADTYHRAWKDEYARNEALTNVIAKLLHYADIKISVLEDEGE